jgi:hypothetical protein
MFIYGVARRKALLSVPRYGNFAGSDWVIVCGLLLRGRFATVAEPLFVHRHHKQRSVKLFSKYDRIVWLDPRKRGAITFPTWRRHVEYFRAITSARLSFGERTRCYRLLLSHVSSRPLLKELVRDVRAAVRRVLSIPSLASRPIAGGPSAT